MVKLWPRPRATGHLLRRLPIHLTAGRSPSSPLVSNFFFVFLHFWGKTKGCRHGNDFTDDVYLGVNVNVLILNRQLPPPRIICLAAGQVIAG